MPILRMTYSAVAISAYQIYVSSVFYSHMHILGLIVSKGSGSYLNEIYGFEAENDTNNIVSIIGPQNVGPLESLSDHDM